MAVPAFNGLHVLLATAKVILLGPNGNRMYARALLDQGSEVSFIVDSAATLLQLSRQNIHVRVSGLGASSAGAVRHSVQVTLRSAQPSNFQLEFTALVLQKLTNLIPSSTIPKADL